MREESNGENLHGRALCENGVVGIDKEDQKHPAEWVRGGARTGVVHGAEKERAVFPGERNTARDS